MGKALFLNLKKIHQLWTMKFQDKYTWCSKCIPFRLCTRTKHNCFVHFLKYLCKDLVLYCAVLWRTIYCASWTQTLKILLLQTVKFYFHFLLTLGRRNPKTLHYVGRHCSVSRKCVSTVQTKRTSHTSFDTWHMFNVWGLLLQNIWNTKVSAPILLKFIITCSITMLI